MSGNYRTQRHERNVREVRRDSRYRDRHSHRRSRGVGWTQPRATTSHEFEHRDHNQRLQITKGTVLNLLRIYYENGRGRDIWKANYRINRRYRQSNTRYGDVAANRAGPSISVVVGGYGMDDDSDSDSDSDRWDHPGARIDPGPPGPPGPAPSAPQGHEWDGEAERLERLRRREQNFVRQEIHREERLNTHQHIRVPHRMSQSRVVMRGGWLLGADEETDNVLRARQAPVTKKDDDLWFFLFTKGDLKVTQEPRTSIVGEDNEQFSRVLQREYRKIRTFSVFREIGFVYVHLWAVKDDDVFQLINKLDLMESDGQTTISHFKYLLRHPPPGYRWSYTVESLIADARNPGSRYGKHCTGGFVVMFEIIESLNSILVLFISFLLIPISAAVGVAYAVTQQDLSTGLTLSGYIITCCGVLFAILAVAAWFGLDKPDTYSSLDDFSVDLKLGSQDLFRGQWRGRAAVKPMGDPRP